MRISVGLKIGGGFFLLTLTLIVAGIVGYMGARTLGSSIENIGSNAMATAQSGSDFSIAIQKQTAITQSIVEAISLPDEDELTGLSASEQRASSALGSMKGSDLISEDDINQLGSRYENYLQTQKDLLTAHTDYVNSREEAFAGFNEFESYMKLLEFYTNQIYNLPNIDQSDKIELTAEFYQSKVALQLRFYYVQRYLGGDDEMLDPLESAEDDLTDEAEELSDLDLVDNTIRTGEYENQNYIDVLEQLVEQHTEQFDTLVSNYQNFKQVQKVYEAAEESTLTTTAGIVDSIKDMVAGETESATLTAGNVYNTILIAIGVGVLLAILATSFSITRVAKPIKKLAQMAAKIARGNLDVEIAGKSSDEVGDLANNFDTMRVQIRKRLLDLEELNQAGETIVSAVDQNEALQKSLETMFRKTQVQQASVYLFDKENKLALKTCFPPKVGELACDAARFGVGEGVAGLSVEEKRIVYIENTLDSELFQNPDADAVARSLLCVPLLDGDVPLGVMNFSGDVGKVHFEGSDYQFAESIARSVVITIKNIRMREVIEEQNQNLELKVEERTQALQEKTNDILSMMQHMHQGLFTIMNGGVVHPEYAAYLERIFETEQVANRHFMDLLFSSAKVGKDQIDQVATAIDAIIGEDEMMWEFNSHLLFNEYTTEINGQDKIIAVEWDPIVLNEVIDKVMVTVRDVTQLKGLEKEAEAKRRELDIISEIISIDQDKFAEFIQSAQQFIIENRGIIEQHDDKDEQAISHLFRNMHTIKGNARTYSFRYITDSVHHAENTYDSLRKEEDSQWNQALLLEELSEVEELVNEYLHVCEDVLGRNVSDTEKRTYEVKSADLESIAAFVEKLDATAGIPEEELAQVKEIVHAINAVTLEKSLEDTCRSLESIARQLGKPSPNVVFDGGDLLLKKEAVGLVNNVFSHLLRNSMDHGIEDAEERSSKGKTEAGNINIHAEIVEDAMVIEVADDGRGLNLQKLKEKGVENGVFAPDQVPSAADLAALIFESGMSTKQSVSSISGRGVGMDAVKQFIEEQGGSVSINLPESSNDAEFSAFQTVLKLPLGMV